MQFLLNCKWHRTENEMRFTRKRKNNYAKDMADLQVATNQRLVTEIKEAMSYLRPEADNEQILTELVVVLTPMAETGLLNMFQQYIYAQAENKLSEVKEMYAHFFMDTDN